MPSVIILEKLKYSTNILVKYLKNLECLLEKKDAYEFPKSIEDCNLRTSIVKKNNMLSHVKNQFGQIILNDTALQ